MTSILSMEHRGESRHPSRPFPLGVSEHLPDAGDAGGTVNVAVYAPEIDAIDIHFQAADGTWSVAALEDCTDGVHHGTVRGFQYGTRYGFWPRSADAQARRPEQLLLDPYGRAIDDGTTFGDQTAPEAAGAAERLSAVRSSKERLNQALTPVRYLSVYVDTGFDWGTDKLPQIPLRDTVIYEAHVKGQTMLHPDIPEELRGTYAGFAHPVMIRHLTSLGVTAVELLPVHFHIDEPHLQELGLTNYWGYNTLGFFAPHPDYATKEAQAAGPKAVQDEFKEMVKRLHAAGLEVILDVVYNHTAEGGQDRPALSWRGLAGQQYYRHDGQGRYVDTTGCGNTVDFSEPRVVQLAMDSLRCWVEEYHIDGFRFDLATALARDSNHHFNPRHPFLLAACADKALRGIKLIAEPWDVGMGGWQTGNFPPGWADWNDRFRDTVRDFWLVDQAALAQGSQGGSVARLAGSLAGSADVFAGSGRTQLASINFVTSHDGFTLADLTSYDRKHNEDNGEENRDGTNENRSYNHGVEGQTGDEAVLSARAQTARNLMATLALSLGVPMITAGDELGRTQLGNNNAYSQDNEISWLDWQLDEYSRDMLRATTDLFRIRREFLDNQPRSYPARPDSSYMLWFNAQGQPMTPEQWTDPGNRVMQLLMGSPDGLLDGLLVINGGLTRAPLALPDAAALREFGVADGRARMFELRYSTSDLEHRRRGARIRTGEKDTIAANSISIYRA
jgi:glycogen debranching enzyme